MALQTGFLGWKHVFWAANANFVRFAVYSLLLLGDIAVPFFYWGGKTIVFERARKMKKILQHLQSWCGCYCILLLLLIIVILSGMRNTNSNSCYQNGRYQIASNGNNSCWVIDTDTNQLWLRNRRGGYELGTNSNPRWQEIDSY